MVESFYNFLLQTKEPGNHIDYVTMTLVVGFCVLVLLSKLMNYKSKYKPQSKEKGWYIVYYGWPFWVSVDSPINKFSLGTEFFSLGTCVCNETSNLLQEALVVMLFYKNSQSMEDNSFPQKPSNMNCCKKGQINL